MSVTLDVIDQTPAGLATAPTRTTRPRTSPPRTIPPTVIHPPDAEPRPVPAEELGDFIRSTCTWESSPVVLPGRICGGLLVLASLNADAAVVSLAALRGRFSCDSLLCATTTLGHNPAGVLVLSSLYLVGLITVAVMTRGFTVVGGAHLATLVALAVIGTIAASGAAAAAVAIGAAVASLVVLVCVSLFCLATGRTRAISLDR